MVRLFLSLLMISMSLACSKEDVLLTLLYTNNFELASDLNDFTINFGDIKITNEDPINNSSGCLNIFGWCLTPNLSKGIGPFDKNYTVQIESWIKTDYGAAIHLNLKSQTSNYVRIETKEDLFEARKWNLYKSGKLDVPKGERLMLYVDASNNTLSNTWIDELKILGQEY